MPVSLSTQISEQQVNLIYVACILISVLLCLQGRSYAARAIPKKEERVSDLCFVVQIDHFGCITYKCSDACSTVLPVQFLIKLVSCCFQLTRIQNGMVVFGHETHSPIVTLAVVYNVGARHETNDDVGLTHCLRMAVNQVPCRSSLFMAQFHSWSLVVILSIW